jgi:hypothetical protein
MWLRLDAGLRVCGTLRRRAEGRPELAPTDAKLEATGH